MESPEFIIPPELFHKFNDIKFYDSVHKYYVEDKNLISVTTLLHKFEESFDSAYWSEVKGLEYNMDQIEVMEMWNAWNKKSTIKGSAIHNYAELKFNNKQFVFTQQDADEQLGEKYKYILKEYPILYKDKVDSGLISKMEGYTIIEEYEIVKEYVNNFYKDTLGILIPIKTEYVVYDKLWGLAGMMDILFWNRKHKCFQIWDWKTNKEFTLSNEYNKKLKPPLNGLDECHINLYSLQLSAYKAILERNTGIKIGGMYVVHFNEKNPNYVVHKCFDYSEKFVNLMETQFAAA